MKKGRFYPLIFLLIAALMLSAAFSGCGASKAPASSSSAAASSGAPAGDSQAPATDDFPAIKIRYDTPFGATHPFSGIDQKWMDELKEAANISVEPYYSSTLISAASPYTEVLAGVADAVYALNGSESDHFYIANAVQVFSSWGTTSTRAVYETMCQMLQQCEPLKEEYKGVVPYGIRTSGETLYLITREPVRTIDDLKGMTIRIANDSMGAVVSAFGGIPLRLEVPEQMEALQKGIINGVMLPAECLKSMSFAEPCKYATALHLVDPFGVEKYIREETYNKFTDAQKAAFDEVGKNIDFFTMETNVVIEEEGIEYGKENGVEFIELPAEDLDRINQALSDYAQELIKELNGKGYDGQGIYDLTRSLLEENIALYG